MNILEKKENIWLIEDYEASKFDNYNIYIKNDWPHNFISSQNKKLFACGICNPKLQSKVKFIFKCACLIPEFQQAWGANWKTRRATLDRKKESHSM